MVPVDIGWNDVGCFDFEGKNLVLAERTVGGFRQQLSLTYLQIVVITTVVVLVAVDQGDRGKQAVLGDRFNNWLQRSRGDSARLLEHEGHPGAGDLERQ